MGCCVYNMLQHGAVMEVSLGSTPVFSHGFGAIIILASSLLLNLNILSQAAPISRLKWQKHSYIKYEITAGHILIK